MTNEELYEAASEAIVALFSDKSVSPFRCHENLESLQGEIDIMLDTLDEE